ncbi:MAG: molybdopterin-dependent oxidoreductase, partial [Acidobacteria bacterium]|nr:molybdopterin-dependent oxidoreductase [Acidobacteriota bacterium]
MKADRHIVRGACPLDCPDTCSWEVTVEDGRAVDLRGTQDHPFTRGSLCAKVDRYLDVMHAPDRLLYPMRRVGRKGEGKFERTAWSDAIAEFADRLQGILA